MCRITKYLLLILVSTLLSTGSAHARGWVCKAGKFKLEADLISFNDSLAVLKRPTGELVAIEVAELSDADQKYVRSKETEEATAKSADQMQVWTGRDGMKVRGQVVAFGRKEVEIQRKFGQVHINGEKLSSFDPLHQAIIFKTVAYLEKVEIEDEKALREWAKSLGGMAKRYTIDGVRMQLESGDEIPVPFFLFAADELKILEPGWQVWLEREESEKEREREDFLMRSAAMAYQRDQAAKQQIEILKLDLLATAAGVTSIWEVGLVPKPNVYGRPLRVMVPAQNSQAATIMALRRYPRYTLAGVRRASR